MNISTLISGYESLLHYMAEFLAYTLELIGILIIAVGSIKALILLARRFRHPSPFNIVINLGRSLALALEFKMGAEIINTVIVHDLKELATLAVVILIRALLAVIIHWEIKMERQDEESKEKESKEKESSASKH